MRTISAGLLALLVSMGLCAMDYKPKNKVVAAASAPVRTGSPTKVDLGTANTGSTSYTVPSDATFAICGVTGYIGTQANIFSGVAGSLKLNGVNFTNISGGDTDTGNFQGAMFYLANPATGTQTVAWDWNGTTAMSNGANLVCGWYKGVNGSTPVRSSSCTQTNANPKSTASLTAVTNDLIVTCPWSYSTGGDTFTINVGTVITQFAQTNNGQQAWTEYSPTGNQVMTANQTPSSNDGGICGITLRP